MKLTGREIVLGVTGGIAAYKSAEIVSRLRKLGANVHVIMTKNATQFITPLTMETMSNNPVAVDTFDRPATWEVEHIALAKRAEVFVIAPATANIMAKMACGIADDMLSTTVLATRAPVMIAPAMNTGMWDNPATQQNLRTLESRGVQIVAPATGYLACGDSGAGKLEDVSVIAQRAIDALFAVQDMKGLRVMVTAGPTKCTPRAFSSRQFSWVISAVHMPVFIAGATSTGALVARTVVESMSSAMPFAILPMMFAVAGAIRNRSARLASAICSTSHVAGRSKVLTDTG